MTRIAVTFSQKQLIGASSSFATTIAIQILGLGSGAFIARAMGVEARGIYAIVILLASFVATVATLGQAEAVAFFTSRHAGKGRDVAFKGQMVALFAGAGPVAAITVLLSVWLDSAVAQIVIWFLPGLFLSFVLTLPPAGAARGEQQWNTWNLTRVAPAVIWFVVSLLGWHFGLDQSHEFGMLFIITSLASGYVTLAIVRKRVPHGGVAAVTKRDLAKYGLVVALTTLPYSAVQQARAAQLLLVLLVSAADLGLIAVALSIATVSRLAPATLAQVWFPLIARARPSAQRREFLNGTAVITIAGIVGAVVVGGVGFYALPWIFGSEYAAGAVLVPMFAVGTAAEGIKIFFVSSSQAIGEPKAGLWMEILTIVLTAIVTPLAVLHSGLFGAAMSFAAVNVTGAGFSALFISLLVKNNAGGT